MVSQFFASPTKKHVSLEPDTTPDGSREPSPLEKEVVDLSHLDDEDIDRFIGHEDDHHELVKESSLGKRKSPTPTSAHLLGPSCPVCSKALGPGASNQALNEHIDWCLNKDAISEASKRTPKKATANRPDTAKRKKVGGSEEAKGSMLNWLNRPR